MRITTRAEVATLDRRLAGAIIAMALGLAGIVATRSALAGAPTLTNPARTATAATAEPPASPARAATAATAEPPTSPARTATAATAELPASPARTATAATAEPPASPARAPSPLLMGTAWYPEQWPQARWEQDLSLMEAAHINVVRVAEFAWSTLEPRDGQFEFEWLDRAIAQASRHHIRVVLGTPTAAPPAWLTAKYPEVLRVDENGRPEEHGERQQFSFSSPRYRQLARRIAEKMAIHYGHNPDVIGWQIDNEIGPPSFDQDTRSQFHTWLQHKYGDIGSLNKHWTTAYWSQTYDNFTEVPMHSKNENPGLLLDWKRFVTDTWADYIDNQVEVIRQHAEPRQFITTNTMHWNSGFDHYIVHRALDMAAWDEYVPNGRYEWLDYAAQHDLVRGYKRANFWLMETQPGFVNWGPVNRSLDPGQVREIAWQAVGHGADAVLYWQWRSALNGQEQYHGTLLGADGTPVPIYSEVQKIGDEFAHASTALSGTTPHSSIAMLQSYESRWAIDWQRHHKDFGPVAEFDAFYRPLKLATQSSIDVVSTDAPLQDYALVVAPALNVISAQQAEHLAEYVRQGGHLVLGPRSGMKDPYNALWPQRQPGPLATLLGGRVEQFYALDQPVTLSGVASADRQASIWAETLEVLPPQPERSGANPAKRQRRDVGRDVERDAGEAHVWMTYDTNQGWLSGKPAALTRKVGKGSITYIGAWLSDGLMQTVAARLLEEAGVTPTLPGLAPNRSAAEGIPRSASGATWGNSPVEICERVGTGKRIWIIINHGARAEAISLPVQVKNVIVGSGNGTTGNNLPLAPHDVVVLEVASK